MVSVEDVIYKILSTDAGVLAIVGTGSAGKPSIWPDQADQDSPLPRLIISLSDGQENYHMLGDAGIRDADIEIECQATTASKAAQLRNAVLEIFKAGKQGFVGTCWISRVFARMGPSISYNDPDGQSQGLKAKIVELEINYK